MTRKEKLKEADQTLKRMVSEVTPASPPPSGDFQSQLDAQAALIATLQSQVADLQTQLANKANNPGMPHMSITFSNPPTAAQLNDAQSFINDLVDALQDV